MAWDMRITNAVVVFLTHQETARLCRTTMACYAFTSIKLQKKVLENWFAKVSASSFVSSKNLNNEACPYSSLSKDHPAASYRKMDKPFAKGTFKSVYLGTSRYMTLEQHDYGFTIVDCMNLIAEDTNKKHSISTLVNIMDYLALLPTEIVTLTKINKNFEGFSDEWRYMQQFQSPLIHQFSYAVYSDEDCNWLIVSELACGGSLHEFLMHNWAPLAYSQRKNIVLQIAQSLALIHSKGIVHGDLKLSNMLVFEGGIKNNRFRIICSFWISNRWPIFIYATGSIRGLSTMV